MNDLDSRTRDLIDAARDVDAPSVADRRRIKHKIVMRLLALGVAGSSATVATAAGTMSAGAKIGLTVVAVLVAGGGTMGVIKLRSPESSPCPVRARAVAVAVHEAMPAAMPKSDTLGPPHATLDEVNPAQGEPLRSSAKVRLPGGGQRRQEEAQPKWEAQPLPADQLNAEVAVLKRAREQLRLGRPGQALEALAEYDRQFGKGVLAEERQAMAAIATCQAQPGLAARARAESFLRSSPNSPLLGRVRAACTLSPFQE
jgi:hypothetical protein